ncbi:hypothetical protein [Spirosoma radiotolerans]|uniref:Uncharacterized protein n=1 Tax=Spirosoma radiotolerans TaxID=1379870 RepID=A0A0E3V9D5_9BACT|nr:hypothetical protein [Spirosoma radiotolerans]AKD57046.1 hypothetical protein SD10_21255 [Spirosoma radiotolerans]
MKRLLTIVALLLLGVSAMAQTKPATATPPSVVSVIEGVSGKRFLPDTAYAALSDEDEALIAKEPLANWGLIQASSRYISYSNLVIGTRSYQLLIAKSPKEEFPVATLMRYTTPKSKPEPIARGTLKPKVDDKAK